jgi:cytochrome c oxidase cbb3-type subunit 2
MDNPRDVVPESNMPAYPWLGKTNLDPESIAPKMRALQKLGHPYTEDEIAAASKALEGKTELDALVAYLQGLGIQIKAKR